MSKTINSTPKADGFRMPGEFEEQTQIWTGWPVRGDVWPGFARPVQKTMREVILAIAEFEPVTVLCCESHYDFCRNELPQNENIRIVEMSWPLSLPIIFKMQRERLSLNEIRYVLLHSRQSHRQKKTV